MPGSLEDQVRRALARVRAAAEGPDVLAAGLVEPLAVSDQGDLVLRIAPGPEMSPDLVETVRLVASGVPGIRDVRFERAAARPAPPPEGTVAAPSGGGRGRRALPVMGTPAAGAAAAPRSPGQVSREEASRHPRDAQPLEGIRHVVAVSSGKGGVGKSTVSTNLAAAWARRGWRVGLLDADIYGPDIPTMFGVRGRPRMEDDRVVPIEAHGVKLMSLGFLVDDETPAIWRGPIVMGIIRQFLQQVAWGELDVLVVDLPPGTGDAQLSLVQLARVSGAVMVTTPQDVSVQGVLKGIRMFESVEVPVLGVVENMRGFVCPDCETVHEIFGSGGGEKLAASLGIPFLGAVPLGLAVREEGDRGVPTVVGREDSPEARALRAVADAAADRLAAREVEPAAR
ncbi:MAG: Mrp/NBP35 family ATP-binding protein [Gemmatimonadota bacterium]|nr:Mrp/NBP35 family ATP-binding protein [Gemmatimonadota bacterium]